MRLLGAELETAQDFVCEVTQTREVPVAAGSSVTTTVRGGTTIVIRNDGRVRYAIAKELHKRREQAQIAYATGAQVSSANLYCKGAAGPRSACASSRVLTCRTRLPTGVLNIRMYRVGFGDSFLLSFPVGGEHRHVLVDCGAHAKGTLGNLEKVAQNISEVTGNQLAAIVATHRHQDHIWGFERGRDVFRQMQIGEVWLPWVEELGNLEARALWKNHEEMRARLEARLAMAPAGPRRDAVEAVLLNLKPNQVALEELRSRFGQGIDGVKYLHGGHPDLVGAAGIDGLIVKILGPPKSEDFLKKMRAPKAEQWARAAADDGGEDGDLFDAPFDARWEDPTRAPTGRTRSLACSTTPSASCSEQDGRCAGSGVCDGGRGQQLEPRAAVRVREPGTADARRCAVGQLAILAAAGGRGRDLRSDHGLQGRSPRQPQRHAAEHRRSAAVES